MKAYYNEVDTYAAQWLRNLISEGLIAHGDVDERSIEDVTPSDLAGYTQCHFFAGIGGWSLALRNAGWSDSRGVWTGSCPCQPFSTAGKGNGTSDERHLWPSWFHLIRVCQPSVVFGEQVEAAINHGWLDLVQTDLEGEGYAFGAFGIPAGGVGAPHIRQRLWFVADSHKKRLQGIWTNDTAIGRKNQDFRPTGLRSGERSVWDSSYRLKCTDGKARPIEQTESRTFPLAHGIPRGMGQGIPNVSAMVRSASKNRNGRLKAYGNAIVPQVASEVIRAYMECKT